MLQKLKEKKAVLEKEKAHLLSLLETVENKIGIVDEMIAEETPPVPVATAPHEAVAETAEKKTVEFGNIRSSF